MELRMDKRSNASNTSSKNRVAELQVDGNMGMEANLEQPIVEVQMEQGGEAAKVALSTAVCCWTTWTVIFTICWLGASSWAIMIWIHPLSEMSSGDKTSAQITATLTWYQWTWGVVNPLMWLVLTLIFCCCCCKAKKAANTMDGVLTGGMNAEVGGGANVQVDVEVNPVVLEDDAEGEVELDAEIEVEAPHIDVEVEAPVVDVQIEGDANIEVEANVDLGVNVEIEVEGDATAQVEGDAEVQAEAEVEIEVEAEVGGEAEVEVEAVAED